MSKIVIEITESGSMLTLTTPKGTSEREREFTAYGIETHGDDLRKHNGLSENLIDAIEELYLDDISRNLKE